MPSLIYLQASTYTFESTLYIRTISIHPLHPPREMPRTTTYTTPICPTLSQVFEIAYLEAIGGFESHTLPFAYSLTHCLTSSLVCLLTHPYLPPCSLNRPPHHNLQRQSNKTGTEDSNTSSGFRYRVGYCPFFACLISVTTRLRKVLPFPSYFVLRMIRAFCVGSQRCGNYQSGRCCVSQSTWVNSAYSVMNPKRTLRESKF